MTVKIKVWDLPLRIFHWLLVAGVIAAYVTAKLGGAWTDWHGRVGVFLLGLLIFRLIWGFAGSRYSRFTSFFPTPAKIITYFKGEWREPGHSPLGALAVIALLLLLAVLVGTGLFANDDIAFQGPLSGFVDKELSDRLSGLHAQVFNLLFGMVALHILAIVFYLIVKNTNLVMPMLNGYKKAKDYVVQPHKNIGLPRFLIAVTLSVGLAWAINDGYLIRHMQANQTMPTKQTIKPVATPSW